MLYSLSKQEAKTILGADLDGKFAGAKMLFAAYLTDSDIVAKILPRPLKPAAEPLVLAYIADFPKTNFGCSYREGAILLRAVHRGKTGYYCIFMPVDDEMAMIYGRELYGYPKKMGNIRLENTPTGIIGTAGRKGVELLRIELEPNRGMETNEVEQVLGQSDRREGKAGWDFAMYLFKHFLSPDGKGFDYIPRFVRQIVRFNPREDLVTGKGKITLASSSFDPVGEVPVRKLVSCFYGTWDNTMMPGKVIARTWNIFRFLPHAFFDTDLAPIMFEEDS
jgi:acetoacetate decarboxylase